MSREYHFRAYINLLQRKWVMVKRVASQDRKKPEVARFQRFVLPSSVDCVKQSDV